MNTLENSSIKAQEWIIRYDGKIKRSESEINSDSHHRKIQNIKKEKD